MERRKRNTDNIVQEIRGVVSARAKAAGYSLVLDSSGESANNMALVVLYSSGLDDLTDAVIKDLNAAAPPGSLDTNSPSRANALTPQK
jgi:Skp family chaperone for outer membrane proteins